jgi:uncharacterized protein YjdB
MTNKNILNYVMYGMIGLIVIIGIIFLTSGEKKPSNEPKEEVKQEVLIIDNTNININVDEEAKINAYIVDNPSAVLTYFSSNNNIVTVDNMGTIKGIDNGTATITVTYVGTNGTRLTKMCVVNVDGGVEITSITLPRGEIVMFKGDTYTLSPEVSPTEFDRTKLSFTSSNPNVVEIDKEGKLTAISVGASRIRVMGDTNIFADIIVRVTDDNSYPTKIMIMPESITTMNKVTMKVDEEKELVYSTNPEDTDKEVIRLKSNDESIVTISDKKLIAKKEGTTTVNLSTLNGISTDIKVVVKPNIIEVKALNITSNTTLNLKVNETSKITYEVTPSNATDKTVSFQSSNNGVATVDQNGNVKAVANGTTTIKVVTTNGMKTKQINVTVTGGSSSSSTPSTPSSSGSSYCKLGTKVGTTKSELLSSPTDAGFDKCKRVSQNLVPYINGVNYGQDGSYVMKVGETLTVNVKLPTLCGKIDTLTRTNHDGQSGWSEYVSQSSNPKVNRDNKSTYVSGVTSYTWKITAKKPGCVTVSQTAQFDVTSPSGRRGNMKSMIRLHIKIEG